MRDCKAFSAEIESASAAMPLSAWARRHAGACARCSDFYRERASLRRLVGELERVEAPSDFELRLRARMAAAKLNEPRAPRFRLGFAHGLAHVAAAACFLAIAASLYFWQSARKPSAVAHQEVSVPSQPSQAAREKVVRDSVESLARPETGRPEELASIVADDRSEERPGRSEVRRGQSSSRERLRESARQPVSDRGGQPAAVAEPDTFAQREAAVIGPRGSARLASAGTGGTAMRIPLGSSSEPLHVVLRDERGAAQRLPMKAVSFGSQAPVARGAMTTPASLKSKEGVW